MAESVSGQPQTDLGELMREGLARAAVELERLRQVAGLQASLTALRLRRRGQREALAERAQVLFRRGALSQPELITLCEMLETTEADMRALEDQIAAVRRGESEATTSTATAAPAAPEAPVAGSVIVLPNGERLCAVCRTPLAEDTMFCPTCGVRL